LHRGEYFPRQRLAFLANDPVAALGFMANRSERVKSILARLLYNSNPATTAAGALTGAALANQEGE